MYNPAIFEDRIEAGKKLAREVKKLKLASPIVLAIPCGGVPVGVEIAKRLKCPLKLIILRKLQIPDNPEAGFGAVTSDKTISLNPEIVPYLGLTKDEINSIVEQTVVEIKRREKVFGLSKSNLINDVLPRPVRRGGVVRLFSPRQMARLENKTVILVDDGLASGYTMLAAIRSVKKQKPKEVLVAVPTASGRAVQLIKPEVDKLVSLYEHPAELSFAVASSYKNWHDLEDEEIIGILQKILKGY